MLFLFISIFFCYLSYINYDPLKSCLYLIFSLLFILLVMNNFGKIWFSFFICLIFLSGIFVILIYFSGLSSFNFIFYKMGLIIFFFSLFFYAFVELEKLNVLNQFYFSFLIYFLLWLIYVLFMFLMFISYMINFEGGLRSIYWFLYFLDY